MKKYSINDLRKIKGFGDKMEERLLTYSRKQDMINKQQKEIINTTPPDTMEDDMLDNIYQGESVEFMRRNIPSNSIDMVLTSPPYDNLRDYNGFYFDYAMMLNEIYRVLKDGGVCVWVVGDATVKGSETGTSFKQALHAKEIGFKLHDTMIYAKNNPIPLTHNRYEQQFEYMFIFSKGSPKTFNPIMKKNKHAGKNKTGTHRKNTDQLEQMNKLTKVKDDSIENNIWFYSVNKGATSKDKIAHQHPAIFPERLAKDHILSWSNEGDIVLDPMCGSGTSCKMAKLNNRRFIGIDISEEYVNLSKRRCDIK